MTKFSRLALIAGVVSISSIGTASAQYYPQPMPFPPPPVFIPAPPPGYMPPPNPYSQGAQMLGVNPEGQIIAGCVGQYGVTYAAGGCAAGELTTREFDKCRNGIGNSGGCFGPSNTLVIHGRNAINDITHGPSDSNDLVGKNGAVRKFLGF